MSADEGRRGSDLMVVVSVLSHAVGCGAWAFYVGFVLGVAVALLGLAAARNEESVTLVVSEKVGLWLKLVDTLLCVCDLKTRLSPITMVARWLRLVESALRKCKVKAVLSSYTYSYGTMTGLSRRKLEMRNQTTHMGRWCVWGGVRWGGGGQWGLGLYTCFTVPQDPESRGPSSEFPALTKTPRGCKLYLQELAGHHCPGPGPGARCPGLGARDPRHGPTARRPGPRPWLGSSIGTVRRGV